MINSWMCRKIDPIYIANARSIFYNYFRKQKSNPVAHIGMWWGAVVTDVLGPRIRGLRNESLVTGRTSLPNLK